MKNLFILTFLILTSSATYAGTMKVMAFNAMCDICTKPKQFSLLFKTRLKQIEDTIERSDPDLIGLQEFRTTRQLKRLGKKLDKEYHILYSNGYLLNYADPALFIRKSRFDIISHHAFWLGPRNGGFSFGWKLGIPRKVRYAKLRDKETGRIFIFASSHFDNRMDNKAPSAALVNNFFGSFNLPVIFAADTNIKPAIEPYQVLMNNLFEDTFHAVGAPTYLANTDYSPNDACNLSKGKTFPACRVDHIMISIGAPFRVLDWAVDVYRYGKRKVFASDHRAVIATLETL